MTEKIYLTDSYIKEFDAKIVEVRENGVILDRTAFYPTGGGQPCDTGALRLDSGSTYNVTETAKAGDEVIHILSSVSGLSNGMSVHGAIDWSKRYMHMRLHTMLHIIDGVVYKDYKGSITGGQIYDDKARMDFDVPGMTKETVMEIISAAQKIIDENHKVTPKVFSKEEAQSIKGLARTAPGEALLQTLDSIRVIDIEGFDFQSDGGTHVANTKEVGKIIFRKYENKGSHNKRVECSLE
ncbi:alanyl-tRNA editing protein [Candidatus Marsarchaeota archaeon]|nr:alanyl-tRNA editing protein [Candidatus Marsarchaeota archaeon]MCL5404913.1 alanyl-tRNA editing protein [Candidatus Marsarchaeota archaeon]